MGKPRMFIDGTPSRWWPFKIGYCWFGDVPGESPVLIGMVSTTPICEAIKRFFEHLQRHAHE